MKFNGQTLFAEVGTAVVVATIDPTLSVEGQAAEAKATGDKIASILPAVTEADDGKLLGVVNGAWAAVEVPSAEEESF